MKDLRTKKLLTLYEQEGRDLTEFKVYSKSVERSTPTWENNISSYNHKDLLRSGRPPLCRIKGCNREPTIHCRSSGIIGIVGSPMGIILCRAHYEMFMKIFGR